MAAIARAGIRLEVEPLDRVIWPTGRG